MLPGAPQTCAIWPFQIPALLKGKHSTQFAAPDFQKRRGTCAEMEDAPVSSLLSHYLYSIYQMSWLCHFRLIRPELSRSKIGSWGVTFKMESLSWQRKKQVLFPTIIWNKTAAVFQQLCEKSVKLTTLHQLWWQTQHVFSVSCFLWNKVTQRCFSIHETLGNVRLKAEKKGLAKSNSSLLLQFFIIIVNIIVLPNEITLLFSTAEVTGPMIHCMLLHSTLG